MFLGVDPFFVSRICWLSYMTYAGSCRINPICWDLGLFRWRSSIIHGILNGKWGSKPNLLTNTLDNLGPCGENWQHRSHRRRKLSLTRSQPISGNFSPSQKWKLPPRVGRVGNVSKRSSKTITIFLDKFATSRRNNSTHFVRGFSQLETESFICSHVWSPEGTHHIPPWSP